MLLSDDRMASFVRDGFLAIDSECATELHSENLRQVLDAKVTFAERAERPGAPAQLAIENEILDRVPGLQAVLQSEPVADALRSILGNRVRIHCHRHAYVTEPQIERGQKIHQDGGHRHFNAWSQYWRRWHPPRRLTVMYYPQEITERAAPTEVIPGSAYFSKRLDHFESRAKKLVVPAGTVAFTHFDLWHRGTDNFANFPRVMLKFVIERVGEPISASWNHDSTFSPDAVFNAYDDEVLPKLACNDTWKWICGTRNESADELKAGLTKKCYAAFHDWIITNSILDSDTAWCLPKVFGGLFSRAVQMAKS